MKPWHRISLAIVLGVVAGGGAAWQATGEGLGRGDVVNGPWSTALDYGMSGTDSLTRAAVARRGLLALPASETIYWQASVDSDGKPLNGSCTYALTGKALDARWWSVTYYDKAGFLVANPANLWSFSGTAISEAERAGWRVTISPAKPAAGHWLPSAKGQDFDLTLRLYNPGSSFRQAPDKAALPALKREGCA